MDILERIAMFFTGDLPVDEMTQAEIRQAIPVAKKQLEQLVCADETPPRELICMPENRKVTH